MPQIIDAYLGLTALRQAGYRSTATAVAELVDNSIEAGAKDIDIVALSQAVTVKHRKSNQVQKIAVLDNGAGMDQATLSKCLSLGWGTRLETRDGLGRFGFGLKGSSISQARRVEVYSWQRKGDVSLAYLDLDEIKSGKLTELPETKKSEIPADIKSCFSEKIGPSGTLVVWSDLDQMDLRRAETLLTRINEDLCRIYRHFLDDCDAYGDKRSIQLHMLNREKTEVTRSIDLKANDPLYLLVPNNLEDYGKEATNVEFCEPFKIQVEYESGGSVEVSDVEFRFSIAKPETQALGGGSSQGEHYGKNTGISFVRAGREIDFDTFGFVERSEPRHRWWGAEVRFDPVLDELFGVTNNKQSVRTVKKLDTNLLKELADDETETRFKNKLLIELNSILSENIKSMMEIIKGRKKGTKKNKGGTESGVISDANKELEKSRAETDSEKKAKEKTEEEKINERVQVILLDDTSLSEKEAKEIAEDTIGYKVDLKTNSWPGTMFLDRRPVANASVGVINRNTKFYQNFWEHLDQSDDRKGFEALEVMLMSFIRAEDELVRTHGHEVFEEFRNVMGVWAEKLMKYVGN